MRVLSLGFTLTPIMFSNTDQELMGWYLSRYLTLMRSWYLLSSSHSCLNVELLTRLGLTTPPCWTEEKLQSVKPQLTEAILHYWYVLVLTPLKLSYTT